MKMRNTLRWIAAGGAIGAAALLGGCVVAPPAYGYGYGGAYGQPAYVQPAAPVLVAPPVTLGIGVGGYYGGRGHWRGRGYWH